MLPELGLGRWERFFDLAERPGDISIERPFYPRRPGGTQQLHLVRGLGVSSMNDLLRACDVGGEDRARACSLFWTLGGNQVGRAAISGWRDAVVPARRALRSELGIWPFDGNLDSLIRSRACLVAETYPADACVQLGLPAPGRGWSKRNRQDRAEKGPKLLEWAEGKPIDLAKIRPMIDDGFGSTAEGEDRFDAVVGLLGMLAVVLGLRPEGVPRKERQLAVEGWILGRADAAQPLEAGT